jgi:hypothetical protein
MPVCAICRLSKPDVKLCADDLLCPACSHDNDCLLAEQRKKQSTSSSSSMQDALSALPTDAELTSKTRASKSRQAKAKHQPPNQPPQSAASTTQSADVNVEIPKTTVQSTSTTMQAMPIAASSSAASTHATTEDVSALHLLLQQQQLTIDALQRKLNFVLEFLGAADFDFSSLATKPSTDDRTTSSAATAPSDSSTNTLTTLPSRIQYSSAVSQGDTSKPKKIMNPFQQAVLTTVNSENRRKIARQANVVISGLPSSSTTTDTELAQHLFRDELSIQSNIVSCQRLGKPSPGKTQLLKVCMSDTSEAAEILAAAKRLRHSDDNYICQHVYINRDMTQSEAEAAYNERCRRRETKQPTSAQPPGGRLQ